MFLSRFSSRRSRTCRRWRGTLPVRRFPPRYSLCRPSQFTTTRSGMFPSRSLSFRYKSSSCQQRGIRYVVYVSLADVKSCQELLPSSWLSFGHEYCSGPAVAVKLAKFVGGQIQVLSLSTNKLPLNWLRWLSLRYKRCTCQKRSYPVNRLACRETPKRQRGRGRTLRRDGNIRKTKLDWFHQFAYMQSMESVSYTHLTLPTIYSV